MFTGLLYRGHVPKQARGGRFGQCEASRRVNPMHHSKVKAKALGNDEKGNRGGCLPMPRTAPG